MPSGSRIVLRTAAEADIPTPDTDQSALFMDADDGNAPAWKDDAGIVHPLEGADAELTYLDHGNTGSTETVDAQAADIQRLVANAATVTLTLSNWPASGTPAVVRLWLEQDGTGGRVWSWPGAVDWGEAGEPDWTTRAGGAIDVVDLMTVDGGTNVIAVLHGRPGEDGAIGPTGGAVAVEYTFSTTTTDSDPGAGNLRLSNATQASATVIRVDLTDAGGADVTALLDSLDDSTNTVKGHIRLFKKSDPTKWLLFTVASIASPSGYRNVTVANVATSGVNPLTNGDTIVLAFTRAGDVGASGTASVGSDPIWDTKGDVAVATAADTAVKHPAPANGKIMIADSGQTDGWKNDYPPGYEFDYVAKTSNTTISATSEGTANSVVTANAVSYDGSTVIVLECFVPFLDTGSGVLVLFFDGSNALALIDAPPALARSGGGTFRLRLTPSNASHTYSVRAYLETGSTNGTIYGGAGTGGGIAPTYIRQVKA